MGLSFIIVSWNTKALLLECLESLFRETENHHWEIIVVDNASTDGSPELVRQRFPEVKLIRNDTNLGFAKANNIGVMQSTGRYIFLINSDVKILQGCIDHMCVFADQHPEIGMLGPKILNPDGTLQPSCMGFPTLRNAFCRALALDTLFPKSQLFGRRLMTFWAHDKVRSVDMLNGCFWMVRRHALNQVGLLDENFFIYGEDIDWCKRFRQAGWQVVFFPGAEAVHYGGASSSNAPIRFYIEMQRANLQYWAKHHSRLAQMAFLLTMWLHEFVRIAGRLFLYLIKPSKRTQTTFKIQLSLACLRWLLHTSTQSREASDTNPSSALFQP